MSKHVKCTKNTVAAAEKYAKTLPAAARNSQCDDSDADSGSDSSRGATSTAARKCESENVGKSSANGADDEDERGRAWARPVLFSAVLWSAHGRRLLGFATNFSCGIVCANFLLLPRPFIHRPSAYSLEKMNRLLLR